MMYTCHTPKRRTPNDPSRYLYPRLLYLPGQKKYCLASQESQRREFAAYKGYSVTEVFQDRGISGGLVDRPAMKDMLC